MQDTECGFRPAGTQKKNPIDSVDCTFRLPKPSPAAPDVDAVTETPAAPTAKSKK